MILWTEGVPNSGRRTVIAVRDLPREVAYRVSRWWYGW